MVEDSNFRYILRESSIHGVKYLALPERRAIERIVWILVLLASLGLSGYFIYLVINKYLESPVIVSFQPSQTSVSEVPFPTVTICSANRFRKSAVDAFWDQTKSEDPELAKEARIILRQLDHICSMSKPFSNNFNYDSDEGAVNVCKKLGIPCYGEKGFHGYSTEHQFPDLMMVKLSTALIMCKDMMPLCLWEGKPISCVDNFLPYMTDMGLCCSFNGMPRQHLYRNPQKAVGMDPPLTEKQEKFWKHFDIDKLLEGDREILKKMQTEEPYLRFQSKAGQGSGLSVLINPDLDEYVCDNHNGVGFRVQMHSIVDLPHVAAYGVAVSPGIEMFISVDVDLTKADPDIQYLDAERRKCFYSKEEKLYSFNFYTASNCLDQCWSEAIGRSCGCVRMDMGIKFEAKDLQNLTYCEGKSFQCAHDVMKKISKQGTDKACQHCKPSCNRIEYNPQLSSLPLRKNFKIDVSDDLDIGDADSESVQKNATIIHIFFGSDNVYSRLRKTLYGFHDLFAHVGGILGLFLGLSVISLIEPINYLFRKCFRRQGKKVNPVKLGLESSTRIQAFYGNGNSEEIQHQAYQRRPRSIWNPNKLRIDPFDKQNMAKF